MFDFNSMVQLDTHLMQQLIYFVKRLMIVLVTEMKISTGRQKGFLWGFVQEKCYADKPETVSHSQDTTPYTRKNAQKLFPPNEVL